MADKNDQPVTQQVPGPQAGKPKKPVYKRVWFWVVVVIAVCAIGGAASGSNGASGGAGSSAPAQEQDSGQASGSAQPAEQKQAGDTAQPAEQKPSVPAEYQSALNKAQSYSSMMHMSKQGIYDQLTSEYGEKFTKEAAQYAVDNLKADYNANALAKAKDYQKQQSMSPSAIHDQLTSPYGEKFTAAEADYAIQHLND